MSEVKWIKLATDLFEDEKLLLIDAMPESDAIIGIWVRLLCFAGKQNNGGVFLMNGKHPYTEEMLASIFRRPVETVRLALEVFRKYGMIEMVDDAVTIPNWGKHQSLDRMKELREYNRLAQQKRRKQSGEKSLPDDVSTSVNDMSILSRPRRRKRRRKRKRNRRRRRDFSVRCADRGRRLPLREDHGPLSRDLRLLSAPALHGRGASEGRVRAVEELRLP